MLVLPKFRAFNKIPRLSREVVITEKIDGTNGVIYVSDDGLELMAGSRTRWLTNDVSDNYNFRMWVNNHKDELLRLGPGIHYGEWWGKGIQRGYDVKEKRFSLFNAYRWSDDLGKRPACCGVVPVLWRGNLDECPLTDIMKWLEQNGSVAAKGFMKPEGIVMYHEAAKQYFKKTFEKDSEPKGIQKVKSEADICSV